MTQWVETAEGGRDRGPRGLVRAWFEVLTGPRRFFAAGVAPGDQAPGLAFAVAVAAIATAGWLATVPASPPIDAGPRATGYLLSFVAMAFFAAPVALHLVAAVQTLVLLAAVPAADRAGVSETVQVIAYATAPCVVAGIPVPALRLLAALYGAGLLALGLAARNGRSLPAALALSVPASALTFGVAYQGFGAAAAVGDWIAGWLASAGLLEASAGLVDVSTGVVGIASHVAVA